MQTRSEFLDSLDQKLSDIQTGIEKKFYYLESEDLLFKPDPSKWNIIEVFEHLNLTNYHYLKQINKALEKASDSDNEKFKLGWMGKQMVKSMEPRNGKTPFKMKTFKKTNPLVLQAQGRKLTDHIVFQDFMEGVKQFRELVEKSRSKDIQKLKIPSLISIMKLKVGDALAFIIAHMERHILQASRLHPEERK